MRIARHITSLLYDYECVVIPGFGGFITKTHHAEVHPVKHQFKPPFKEVVFNPHLRTNDGLLLNHIARTENLSYQDAKRRLDRFVLKCLRELGNGRRIAFRKVGVLYYDDQQQIVFEADQSQNFLASSFGLSGFVSPAIKREGFQEKLEKTFTEKRQEKEKVAAPPKHTHSAKQQKKVQTRSGQKRPMKASVRRKPYKRQLTVVGIFMLILGMAWAIMNQQLVTQYYNSYAGLVPFFYSSPNEYLIKNMEAIPVEKLLKTNKESETDYSIPIESIKNDLQTTSQRDIQPNDLEEYITDDDLTLTDILSDFETADIESGFGENTGNAIQPKSIEAQAVEPQMSNHNVQQNQLSGYHIVAGAFREKENADKLIAQLRRKGYNAQFSGQTTSGLWRVSFDVLSSRSLAVERLAAIQSEENPQAWLLNLN
jgi:hypothetical protein